MLTFRSSGSKAKFLSAALALAMLPHAELFAQAPAPQASAIAGVAATPQANRIDPSANLALHVQLSGHIPAWAVAQNQSAEAVDLAQPVHLTFLLKRAPQVQAAFDQMLADQQNPASPLYHHWLTAQQIGALYGPTQPDIDAIVSWATAQGFVLAAVQPNRILLEFDTMLGTAATAFHTSFARFHVGSRTRLSIVSEPMLPQAFAAVVDSVGGLVETHFEPQSHVTLQTLPASAAYNLLSPLATFNGSAHYLSPADFDTIYDLTSVQSGGNTGATIGSATQRIAIIGRSRVTSSDITAFESISNLPSKLPNVVLAGTDPGISADADEQTLDVERVLGTASGAQVDLVIAASSNNADGVNTALAYNINTLRDPVMSISYGSCEYNDGANSTNSLSALFQTAAGEGITTLVSSGDSGAAGCDTAFTAAPASQTLSVNAICASPYVTCVGGTEFNDTPSPSTYWATSNGTGYSSALGYIPEGAWNEPNSNGGYIVAATGGGASVYIAKPTWQTGTGVPADGHRDVPDVAFSASSHDGYIGCDTSNGDTATCVATSQGTPFAIFSGTSAAAPGMAGIVALLNTRLGGAQGNINPLLYSLATSTPAAFHDATPASSGVTACTTSTPSMCNNSTPGPSSLTGGLAGYALTTGYDQATGLGSLDVAKFLTAAASPTLVSTTLALSAPSPNPAAVGQSVTLKATLTPGTSSQTPTGTVQFYAALGSGTASAIGSAVTLSANTATLAYTFAAAGSYTITAVYSGDSNFATSTAPGVALTISAANYTITPATVTYNLISGATTGNTDAITVTSANNFSGAISLTCSVTNVSGSASGTCSVAPTSVSINASSSAQATLTLATTPGTSGVLRVVVTGTSSGTTISSTPITVNLTAASFTLAASPATAMVSSGTSATSTITLTSANGFAGTVALSCTGSLANGTATTATTCSVSPSSVALTSGGTATATATVPTTAGSPGALTATVSGTGTTTGASLASTASTQVVLSVVNPSFTLTANPAALTFTSGATANNVSTLTLTSVNGFAGAVAVNCAISSSTAGYPPSCVVSPTSVTLTANGTATATLSINSTTAHAQSGGLRASLERTTMSLFAALLFVPFLSRRRAAFRILCLMVLAGAALSLTGCGGSSSAASTPVQSSAGTYTVTISASGTSAGAPAVFTVSATVALTIN